MLQIFVVPVDTPWCVARTSQQRSVLGLHTGEDLVVYAWPARILGEDDTVRDIEQDDQQDFEEDSEEDSEEEDALVRVQRRLEEILREIAELEEMQQVEEMRAASALRRRQEEGEGIEPARMQLPPPAHLLLAPRRGYGPARYCLNCSSLEE